jgi:hypothetical protein
MGAFHGLARGYRGLLADRGGAVWARRATGIRGRGVTGPILRCSFEADEV